MFGGETRRVGGDGRGRREAGLGDQQVGLRIVEDVRHFAVGQVKVQWDEVEAALDAREVRRDQLDAIRQENGRHVALHQTPRPEGVCVLVYLVAQRGKGDRATIVLAQGDLVGT